MGQSIQGEITDAWVARQTIDDRGGTGELIGIFTTETLGKEAAAGRGWYGGPGETVKEKILKLDDGSCMMLRQPPNIYRMDTNLPEAANLARKAAAKRFLTSMSRDEAKSLKIDYDSVLKVLSREEAQALGITVTT